MQQGIDKWQQIMNEQVEKSVHEIETYMFAMAVNIHILVNLGVWFPNVV